VRDCSSIRAVTHVVALRLCSTDPPGDLGLASEASACRRVATERQGGSELRLNCEAMPCDSLGRESEVGVRWGCRSCGATAGVDSVIGNRNYGFGSRSSQVTTDGWSRRCGVLTTDGHRWARIWGPGLWMEPRKTRKESSVFVFGEGEVPPEPQPTCVLGFAFGNHR
jgi:hypothetical protein